MNIKKYIKTKWLFYKKECVNKSKKKSLFLLFLTNLPLSIIYFLGKVNHEETVFFLSFSGMAVLAHFFIYFFEMFVLKNFEKKEEYNKIMEIDSVKEVLKKKKISKEEDNMIKKFCNNSSLEKLEIDLILRELLSSEGENSKLIDNEYLMLKFLYEIDKHEKLKKEFNDPGERIKNQIRILNVEVFNLNRQKRIIKEKIK